MSKTYVTFGQIHAHTVRGKTFDKDCVAVIHCDDAEQGRRLAFAYFDNKWCFEYHEDNFDHDSMKYFHRGFIEVNSA